ncbi:MAG TPA: hypothetical protein VFO76_01145 [Candidatus Kapabacteria bacterium]|nr:hypothetical protein [Candidatus Kapabacteria bacterium]
MKKPTSVLRKIVYSLLSLVILITIAVSVFFLFFFDSFLNQVVRPRFIEAITTASNGQYELRLGEISSHGGKLICRKFDLHRIRFDSVGNGVYLNSISMDSVVLSGISWQRILLDKKVELTAIHFNTPTVTLGKGNGPELQDTTKRTIIKLAQSLEHPVVSIDSIILNNITIAMPPDSTEKNPPRIERASIGISHFKIDRDTTHAAEFLFFSNRIDINVPEVNYLLEDSLYTLSMKNVRANLLDSSLFIDTVLYHPNYPDRAFIAKFPVRRDRLDFAWHGISLDGVNLVKLLGWRGIEFRTGSVHDWSFDYYSDKRKPLGPPQQAVYPHEALRGAGLRIHADSFALHNGVVHVREQHTGSPDQAKLEFSKIEAVIHPVDVYASDHKKAQACEVNMSTEFLGTSVRATIIYPLSDPMFNMDLHTLVGPFDPKRLNQFLQVSDRSEITSGIVESGELTMKIRNGVATTTLIPKYYDLSLKLLSKSTKEKRGILEGLKTFIYNTFKLHSDNSPTVGEKVKSATTTRSRKKQEEFFQYLWFCIRKSLGHVVGGFE